MSWDTSLLHFYFYFFYFCLLLLMLSLCSFDHETFLLQLLLRKYNFRSTEFISIEPNSLLFKESSASQCLNMHLLNEETAAENYDV